MKEYFRVFEKRDAKKCFNIINDSLNADKELEEKIRIKEIKEYNPEELIKKSNYIKYYLLVRKGFFGEKILAMAGFKKSGEIKTVYSNIKFRGQGYGKKIMNYIEKEAKKEGLKKLFLWSSPKAISFYKKRGFKFQKSGDKTCMVKHI